MCDYWKICMRLTENYVSKCEALRSSQEKADSRMIFYAVHCCKSGYSSVVIVSNDTDAFILFMSFADKVACPTYMKCGTRTRIQYVDVGKVTNMLGDAKCCLGYKHLVVFIQRMPLMVEENYHIFT